MSTSVSEGQVRATGTRDAIVAAAARLLDEGGVEAVTLRAVAERVGLSHNAPYKHFLDKEALLSAVAARELRALSGIVDATEGALPVEAVREMAYAYVRWAARYPARFKLTFGVWTRVDLEMLHAADDARARYVRTIAAAQKAGDIVGGDPERVAVLLLSLGHGAADLALGGHLARDGKGHADPVDLIDDLMALMKAGAATRP